jgi:aminopeptidase N
MLPSTLGLMMLALSALPPDHLPGPGVPLALAEARARAIRHLHYDLTFDIPGALAQPVRGRARIRFDLPHPQPIALDYAASEDRVRSVKVGGRGVDILVRSGHILLPAPALRAGANTVEIEFLAGDAPLNRSADFLYTLFVPARASHAFPCFDQPDLKARFTLSLTAPAGWEMISNGAVIERRAMGRRSVVRFAETEPLPTYLFAFAAGEFAIEEATVGDRVMRMFHRETDAAKVARNREVIFDLHGDALRWLERYTGIPYPFGKFDFVLLPAFQFGGMEHPGTIFYNAPALLLDETATQNQELGRASLIAHETAHMWFGDLVTMRWFDDVWMKEVFANFMAAKIVNPAFPDINHDLRFLFAHYPAAYDVDRTPGTHAIRQPLANLAEAGTLYGAIIYQKAPTVIRQLEERMGVEGLQQGLRTYLRRYAFGNASWPDLIEILDTMIDEDLAAWSDAWVNREGRPTIRTAIDTQDGRIRRLAWSQEDPIAGRGLHWPQRLPVTLGYPDGDRTIALDLRDGHIEATSAAGWPAPLFVLPNGRGRGYGRFVLDAASREYLLGHLPEVADPLTRGSAWVTLWDAMLDADITPGALIGLALAALPRETDELNVQRILSYTEALWWRHLQDAERTALAPALEAVLHEGLASARTVSRKAAWFSAVRQMALTADGVAWLERVWERKEPVPELTFSETDEIDMALELAVRGVPRWREILAIQHERIDNPDRRARFAFVTPALSADPAERDRFFRSLATPANRRREPWVLEGLRYLHHPLRAAQAEKHILVSLRMLTNIQRTGDIFFPKRWTDATLGGHASRTAAATVRGFLNSLPPDYPPRLRKIVLASADALFRASASRPRAM